MKALGIAVAVYFLCLQFVFPQYIDPLEPHHSDLLIPVGFLERSWAEVLTYPRPVAHSFLKLIGWLGVKGSIAAVIALVLAAVPLTAALVKKVSGRAPSLLAVALYSTVLFAHPEFYFQHRHDVPAALSYLLLLGAAWAWWERRTGGTLVLLGLLALTKETYVVSALVLLAGLAWLRDRKLPWRALAACAAVLLAGVGWNIVGYRRYVIHTGSDYAVTLAPAGVATGLWYYLRHLFPAVSVLILLLARDWVWIVAGLTALLPHAALPNHLIEEYAWVAAPLVFAPLLLIHARWVYAAAAGVAAMIALAPYWTTERKWAVEQEKQAANVLATTKELCCVSGDNILVVGLEAAYHPWQNADYVQRHWGRGRKWTLATKPGEIRRESFDRVIAFWPDGRLRSTDWKGSLVPAAEGKSDLEAARIFVDARWPEKAEEHARRAAEQDPQSPWPHYFLARAAETRGDTQTADKHLAEASKREPANELFRPKR